MSTKLLPVVLASCLAVGLTACGGGSASKSGESAKDSNEVTVTNCGKKVPTPRRPSDSTSMTAASSPWR